MEFPYTLIDLTHTLNQNTPSWDGSCGFTNDIKLDYKDCSAEVKFRVQQFKMHAGIGTHMDAPAHCIPGGLTIDQIPLSDLVAPCAVIDVSQNAHEIYSVSCQDIEAYETINGIISQDSFVMIKTGWERFWFDPIKYRNNHQFPCLSKEAALMLMERNVCGIGIDTLSPDCPETGFPVHQLFLGKGKYIVENVANLDALPPKGSFIMILPMKIKDATEAPVRFVGMINNPLY